MTSSLTSAGSCALDRRQVRLDRLDHLDGVGARLPPHLERHRRHAVEARQRALLLGAVLGAADVAHADRRAVDGGDDEVVEAARVVDAAHACAASARAAPPVTLPPGTSAFCRRDRVAHGGDRQLVGGQAVGVDPDVDRALEAADDLHLADAGGALELHLDDLVGDLGQLAQRAVAATARRSAPAPSRCRTWRRPAAARRRGSCAQHRRDAVAHVLRRDVDVAVEVEGGDDERAARRRRPSAAPRCPRPC